MKLEDEKSNAPEKPAAAEPAYTVNADGTIHLPLFEPIMAGADKILSLTFKKGKARDLTATDGIKGEVAKAIALIAQLTGQPQMAIGDMGFADFQNASDIVGSFFPKPQTIGATS